MLYLHKSFHFHSGGRLQSGCPERKAPQVCRVWGYGDCQGVSGDNIYQLLLAFDEVYNAATEIEQKEFMRAFIERIDLYPEKQKDGNWIRNIVFNFPVPVNGKEVKELPLETETTLETIVELCRHFWIKKIQVVDRKKRCTRFRLQAMPLSFRERQILTVP